MGFRGSEISSRRDDNRTRLIVVGGSAAFGYGAKSDAETFEAILEGLDNKYEVINAGVVGFLSGQELTYVVTELVDYLPDVVIAYDGWNDLFDSLCVKRRTRGELGFNNTFFDIEKRLINNYKRNRSLKRVVRETFFKEYEGVDDRMARENHDSRSKFTPDKKYFDAVVNTYVCNLTKIKDFLSSKNIKFIVVFQPEVSQKLNRTEEEDQNLVHGICDVKVYKKEFPALYRIFIERAKESFRKNEIDFIDINLEDRFRNNSTRLFTDVVHTNKDGNEVVAKTIKKYLDKIMLKKVPRPI